MKKNLWMFLLIALCQLIYAIPAAAVFDSALFNNNKESLQISSINPAGEDVPASRQLVIHFNRPVVPVGRMERTAAEIPVRIAPSLACEWRWLNTSSLACQLDEKNAMSPSTRYVVEIKPGIKAEDGTTINKTFTHTFISERVKVNGYQFRTWKSPGTPVIQIWFNQPVSRDSVARHLYLLDQKGKRWPVTLTEDPEYVNYKKNKKKNQGTENLWLLTTHTELPLDSRIELKVEKGITPLKGSEPGIEDRVVVAFDTFPVFSFLGIRCSNNKEQPVTITPGQKAGSNEFCNPNSSVSLLFSAPVLTSIVRENLKISPALARRGQESDPWENISDYSHLGRPHEKNREYAVRLPNLLRPYQPYTLQAEAEKIKDEFGRPLIKNIRQMFFMDHYPPAFSFEHDFSILEKNITDSELPLRVTNMERIDLTYDLLTAKKTATQLHKTIPVAKAQDIPYRLPLKVREMIPGSGAVSGTFTTTPLIPGRSNECFFSQITPYNVHVKAGHFNTLVWVTDYVTGLGVSGVAVEVYKDVYPGFKLKPAVLAKTVTNQDGVATLPGTEKIDPQLNALRYHKDCHNEYFEHDYSEGEDESGEKTDQKEPEKKNLFIRCIKGNDMAFVPLIAAFNVHDYGNEGGGVYSVMRRRFGHIHTWGTTAQGIYKAGDTVQFKLYVRNQDSKVFVPPPTRGYNLQVIDPMGKVVHEVKDITLSKFGAYASEFVIPTTAAVGWYRFVLKASFHKGRWEPMQVLISDFTPAPFRVNTDLNGKMFREGETLKVSTQARLHSGGPYANAQTRITATLNPTGFYPDDPVAQGFYFGDSLDNRGSRTLHEEKGAVNNKGDRETEFAVKSDDVLYGQISVESAVRDDRGKYVASQASATYVGRNRYVGVRQTRWVLEKGTPAKVETLVVDENGKPAAGTKVNVQFEYRKTFASRVKGAGNAYLTHFEYEWVKESSCEMTSAAAPVSCELTPKNPGSYRITAEINDTNERTHSTTIGSWVTGKGDVVWGNEEGIGMEIVPEKKEYHVGDKARYLIKNPYPGAKALMTIERYGVIKSWVETLPDSTAIVEFDIEPDYVPGYYFSVSVMSPRVDKPLDKNQVDLGKPAFRIGYTETAVRDPYKEITVKIKPEQPIYKPRDKVTVDIEAQLREGTAKNVHPTMELAVAVLDESVLDLLRGGKKYYDVYSGFYYLDPLDLKNFNLLMQLIGRQKFAKKGANPGGDGGGKLSMRSLFKFVSYWNPSIKTDKDGRAKISFTAPDNLTGWRVLVMAVTPGDRMGLGDANFKVNRETEIRPALPNQVTEGDGFLAGFTIMNRTDKPRTLDVKISVDGPLAGENAQYPRSMVQQIAAEPYKRINVWLPVKTSGYGDIKFKVQAGDKSDSDGLEQSLPVRKRVSLETAATYGTTTASQVSERIAFPADIRTDVGRISVVVSPTVIGNLEGAFKYLRDYPYICWEQVLTKGVMASHFLRLKSYLPKTMKWPDSKTLPDTTLGLAASYQAPNGGMGYYRPTDEYVSPYLSAYTGIAFNWLQTAGYKIPPSVEQKLHEYLLKLLQNDVMPTFYSEGMSSTVRAVALAALAPHGKITRSDLDRYRRHLPQMSLFGKAHYLLAALKVPGTEQLQAEVVRMILAQANETGGKYIFTEKLDSGYDQLLTSTTRDNGAVLSALLSYSETPQGAKVTGAIPFKLVRTITQSRGQRDRWENTQENMFCMNAIIEYSRLYEKDKPKMTLRALFNGEKIGEAGFTGFRDKAAEMQRPIKKQDPGKTGTVTLEKNGTGRVYYATRLSYAPLHLKEKPINSGIEVVREYSVERNHKWVLLKSPMKIKTGELVRVDLFVRLPAARNFVVVDDHVPGGLEPVNRDLATASEVDSRKGDFDASGGSFWFRFGDWHEYGYSHWSFYHRELRHHAARFYSEYLPAGNYHLSYVAQAVAPGDFTVLPLHAEEMYDPDVYGKSVSARLKVEKTD